MIGGVREEGGPLHWVVPVRRRLEKLEAAAAAWDPAAMAEPEWRTEVTPEGETRKRVCRFEDLDGKTETFHLRARVCLTWDHRTGCQIGSEFFPL
ncbi:hypothetical protein [Streptomyces humi]